MYKSKEMLFMYVEENLHAGTGSGMGAVDLPIQREKESGYPHIQASSVRGSLRAAADPAQNDQSDLDEVIFNAIFGPDDSTYAGALAVGDARLLLFSIRSLCGVIAQATSFDLVNRFLRQMEMAGKSVPQELLDSSIILEKEQVLVGEGTILATGSANSQNRRVVLDEFSFEPVFKDYVNGLAKYLADNTLPKSDEYKYWREMLPKRLCILPDDALRDFSLYATEVQTHIKLNPDTKVVEDGALWTEESLPPDCLLYSLMLASPPHTTVEGLVKADDVLSKITTLINDKLPRVQMGGDETTCQGIVRLIAGTGGAA